MLMAWLRRQLEDGVLAIAADVDADPAEGKETFKITLGDIIDNAKSEFDEYNVKNLILAGTYVDDVTETPVDSGNWTINAEKQRMDPGTFVESLNEVKGDVVLTSEDLSITIVPEQVIDPDSLEMEFTGNIDLAMNVTNQNLNRKWETVGTVGQASIDFNDDSLTNVNSVVTVNGVVLDVDQYTLEAGVVSVLEQAGVDGVPLQVGDVVGVISFSAMTGATGFRTGIATNEIEVVGERPEISQDPRDLTPA